MLWNYTITAATAAAVLVRFEVLTAVVSRVKKVKLSL
jgi:hypothetical protein